MPFCRFCFDNKIDGPHDHFLRESKDPSSRVLCHMLLNTICMKCNKKGHTEKYCKVKVYENNKVKEFDEDGFLIIKGKVQEKNNENIFDMKSKNNFMFLCEDSEYNIETVENVKDIDLFSKRPTNMSWADWEEMDN